LFERRHLEGFVQRGLILIDGILMVGRLNLVMGDSDADRHFPPFYVQAVRAQRNLWTVCSGRASSLVESSTKEMLRSVIRDRTAILRRFTKISTFPIDSVYISDGLLRSYLQRMHGGYQTGSGDPPPSPSNNNNTTHAGVPPLFQIKPIDSYTNASSQLRRMSFASYISFVSDLFLSDCPLYFANVFTDAAWSRFSTRLRNEFGHTIQFRAVEGNNEPVQTPLHPTTQPQPFFLVF